MTKLTKEQAIDLINAFDINLEEGEETELLIQNNPRLYEAFLALLDIAEGN